MVELDTGRFVAEQLEHLACGVESLGFNFPA